MAGRRRRGPNAKSLRVSQDQQQQQNRSYDSIRLKPEQVGSLVHDESDTISYRSYLLQNFITSSELIDVLTIHPIPLSKIKPPPVYRNANINGMKQMLAKEKENLITLDNNLRDSHLSFSDNFRFLKKCCKTLSQAELDGGKLESIAAEYASKFNKEVKDDRVVIHKDKFLHLRGDTSEAPPDYWEKHREMVAQKKEAALKLKQLQEEEARKLQEEAENKLREEEEQRVFEEQFQQQQQQAPLPDHSVSEQETSVDQPIPTEPLEQQQQQVSQQAEEQSQQGMLGSIFGEMNGDTFNNGFEDEFADLDTAFFKFV